MNHQLLQAWQNTVRLRGNARAVVQAADGRTATFRELDERSRAWLLAHIPEPLALAGRAVIFATPNGIRWFEILLGLLHAGALAVPLDYTEPMKAQLRLAESLDAAAYWDGTQLQSLSGRRRYRNPELCLIKLTSGSTGRPRPLVFTAAQLLADARQVATTMGITARDLNHALIPLGHSYGLGNLTVPLLAQGVPIVCGTGPLPHTLAADFARWHPTVLPGVPAIWRALVASAVVLPGLRLAISAGAPLPPEMAAGFFQQSGRRLHNFYGSSETGGISYDRSGRATLQGSVGRAMRGVKLVFRRGQRLEVASAAVVTHGNRRRNGKHGRWLMPDCALRTASGDLLLLGRRGSTVKIAGRRINLNEIALCLRRLSGVQDAWVGISAGPEPMLGAAVVTHRPTVELRAALSADMAAWKIPRKWLVLPALPLTTRGKVDSSALQSRLFTQTD